LIVKSDDCEQTLQFGYQEYALTARLLLLSQEETNRTHPPHSLPYYLPHPETIVQDFSAFSKIITKDLNSVVVIQNRSPPALHVLPPGFIKLKLNGDVKGVAE